MLRRRKYSIKGEERGDRERRKGEEMKDGERGGERGRDLRNEHTVQRCGSAEEYGKKKREETEEKGARGEGDDRCEVPFFFCHPPPSLRFRCFHLPL